MFLWLAMLLVLVGLYCLCAWLVGFTEHLIGPQD